MKHFSADWIYTLAGPPVKKGTVTVNDEGIVMAVDPPGFFSELPGKTAYHPGIIVPGFINCHCHLELSHLKDQIAGQLGMGHFVGEISRKRMIADEISLASAMAADNEMFSEGIVAVGDISNTGLTIQVKKNSRISYFTFIEVFGFHPSRAGRAFDMALLVKKAFSDALLPSSVVPHSPYSVSDLLFEKICRFSRENPGRLTIHCQESEDEIRFFRSGDGPILDHLVNNLGIDVSHRNFTPGNPLDWILSGLPSDQPMLLVHNTFTTPDDIGMIKTRRSEVNTYFVLCPNSNLHISGCLPPVSLFRTGKLKICTGTDSLASNHRLSVLSELITLQQHFPDIGTEELLTWGCANGAEALGMSDRVGTLEPGKKPGIVLISGTGDANPRLTPGCRAKRLF